MIVIFVTDIDSHLSEFFKEEGSGRSKLVIQVCMFKIKTLQVFKYYCLVAKMSTFQYAKIEEKKTKKK